MAQQVKNLPVMQKTQRTWVRSLGQEDALEEEAHPGVLAWRIHGRRSLLGYSPWGCKESDTTERLSTQTYLHFLRPFFQHRSSQNVEQSSPCSTRSCISARTMVTLVSRLISFKICALDYTRSMAQQSSKAIEMSSFRPILILHKDVGGGH